MQQRFGIAAVLALCVIGARPAAVQEYLLPAPVPPVAACNSIVSQGSDKPETHDIDVSGTIGTVDFQYDTYAQPDRMIVSIDGRQVYDTTCLGTRGLVEPRKSRCRPECRSCACRSCRTAPAVPGRRGASSSPVRNRARFPSAFRRSRPERLIRLSRCTRRTVRAGRSTELRAAITCLEAMPIPKEARARERHRH